MIVILLDAMVIRDKNEYRVRPVNIYPIKSKYLSNKSVLIAQTRASSGRMGACTPTRISEEGFYTGC